MEPTTLQAVVDAGRLAARLVASIRDLLAYHPTPVDAWAFYALNAWAYHMDWTPFGNPSYGLFPPVKIDRQTFDRVASLYPDVRAVYWRTDGSSLVPADGPISSIGRQFHPRYHVIDDRTYELDQQYQALAGKNDVFREWLEFGQLCGWAVWQELCRQAGWPPAPHGDDYENLYKIDDAEHRNTVGNNLWQTKSLYRTKLLHDTLVWYKGPPGFDASGRRIFVGGAKDAWMKILEDRRHRLTASGMDDKSLSQSDKLNLIFEAWTPYVHNQMAQFASAVAHPAEFAGMTAPRTDTDKLAAKWYGPPVPWAFELLAAGEQAGDRASPWYYAALFPRLFHQWYPNRDSPAMMIAQGEFGV
jgi:hypothetical protein